MAITFNRPRIRVLERTGSQTTKDTGKPNTWAADLYCERETYQICHGRLWIEAEKEEAALERAGKGA